MSNLISAVAWVKRGVAVQHPEKYVLDDKELERVSALARIELEDARIELERAHLAAQEMDKREEDEEGDDNAEEDDEDDWVDEDDDAMDVDSGAAPKPKAEDDLAEYNLDDYDNDEPTTAVGPFSNIKGLTYYKDNEEDPYITLKDEDDDEREELEVLPTDNLIVVAKTEDEISQLEIYVYDESQENLYAHHDLMLPNFPLCLEWLDFPPASSSSHAQHGPHANGFGNYIAVGTLDPEIEIWSLDVLEAMYPSSILGRPDETKAHVPVPSGTGKKKKKKPKHREAQSAYHVGAVLGLSWNRHQRNLLASASADRTVKLWDLSRDPTVNGEGGEAAGAIRSFDVHKGEVQAVKWNNLEPTVLLTGSFDRTVRTFDSRAPTTGVGAIVGSDVEALCWDPWESYSFYVSLENGLVLNFDARTLPSNLEQPSPARFTVSAHDGPASSIDVNPHMRGCIVTGGADKLVKVWNVDEEGDKRNVSLVTSRDLGVGKVFSTVFSPDDPLTLAAAGSKAKLQIWDVGSTFGARKAFGAKLRAAGKELKEKEEGKGGVIGVQSDDEESDADEDE
ncbi:putative WD repeat-containing protein C17D11.16 [Psilocybe cubensis]|uniref:WD repeat-containing protein C17D11.16 n=2 Tax=Psilocybe cubensis TaxID=181762 RepID=A0ACB8GZX5_PSICU|nr:putative WD repeat-containing protein C17D11.16 [Psilocybe cubensis]KAH9481300.1 putative WD repeat-containing protein C17D11.16 [Psilocybe cubensis]